MFGWIPKAHGVWWLMLLPLLLLLLLLCLLPLLLLLLLLRIQSSLCRDLRHDLLWLLLRYLLLLLQWLLRRMRGLLCPLCSYALCSPGDSLSLRAADRSLLRDQQFGALRGGRYLRAHRLSSGAPLGRFKSHLKKILFCKGYFMHVCQDFSTCL